MRRGSSESRKKSWREFSSSTRKAESSLGGCGDVFTKHDPSTAGGKKRRPPVGMTTSVRYESTGEKYAGSNAEYWGKCNGRAIDQNWGGEQNRNCSRELVAGFRSIKHGCGLFAPVCRTAARERSRTAGRTELVPDYGTLHPPRPSGRSPQRPLIFFGREFLQAAEKVHLGEAFGVRAIRACFESTALS
jgi:hypothetical protein